MTQNQKSSVRQTVKVELGDGFGVKGFFEVSYTNLENGTACP